MFLEIKRKAPIQVALFWLQDNARSQAVRVDPPTKGIVELGEEELGGGRRRLRQGHELFEGLHGLSGE